MEYELDFLNIEKDLFSIFKFELNTEKSNIIFFVQEDISGIMFDDKDMSIEAIQDFGKLINNKSFIKKLQKEILKAKRDDEGKCPECGFDLIKSKYNGGHL